MFKSKVHKRFTCAGFAVLIFAGMAFSAYAEDFESPKAAAEAVLKAAKSDEPGQLLKVFGDDAKDLISTGDDVADKQTIEEFKTRVKQLIAVSKPSKTSATLVIGPEAWPFPIPLVKKGDRWHFDIEAGREIIKDRLVGENELDAMKSLRALVNAEYQYSDVDYDDDGVFEYAQKIVSTPGEQDGLYWPAETTTATISPIGPLFVNATAEGYKLDHAKGPKMYHGYRYKILTSQGEGANGGAYSYIQNGNMVSGFAILAWPAKHGDSGIMTFMADSAGNILSKDLGKETEEKVSKIDSYNPDENWVIEP